MIPPNFAVTWYVAGFPRVSGDDPLRLTDDLDGTVFSPRERG